ncbi:MAG: ABC transporter substrate-binding protein [Chloroflexia bacterium]|nr:ABC transporter substrate-binding protein [Chloroflexia bacterium]
MGLSKNSISTLGQDGFSRRTLLRGVGALTALGALSPLMAACGSDDDEPGPASGTTENTPVPAAQATTPAEEPTTTDAGDEDDEGDPVSGGTLTFGEFSEPPIMDPRVSGATIAWRLFYNIFDPLLVQDTETGDFLPGLASTWEVSEDGLIYTLGLKEDVTFHDGTDFNAEAVKFTFDSILEPELKSLAAIGYLGPYDRTDVIDDLTAEVHFTDPYAPFLNNLSHSVLSPVSPAAVEQHGEDFGFNPVGTGPFMFQEWQQQTSMILVRNPDYNWPIGVYQHEGPAHLDQITINFISEPTTMLGTLMNGETDVIDAVQAQEVERLQADDNFQILLPTVPGSPQVLPLNAVKPPTDDLKVRQAIIQAVDMEAVVDTLWYGTRKAAQGPLSSPTWSYNPVVETMYPYDPDAAGALLDEAGWTMGSGNVRQKDGENLHLIYITTGGSNGQAGELVQAYLLQAGFEVDLQILEYAATASLMLAGEHNIARIYFSHTDPVVLTTLYHSRNIEGTNFNRTMKPDDTLDEMLNDATSEMDVETRRTIYEDIQEYVMDEALIIPLWEETVLWGARAGVKGLHFQPLGGAWFYDVWLEQ